MHIAIEGVIGVGKTTLARALARKLNARLLLEKPKENPFLERFYREPVRYALSTQLCFLLERADQLQEAAQGRLFDESLVADFMLAKDALFAKLNLSDSEFSVYENVHAHLSTNALAQPDVVIYLRAPVALCRERIQLRGINMEQRIEDTYLEKLDAAYAAFFSEFHAAPVLFIDAAKHSPASDDDALDALVNDLQRLVVQPVPLKVNLAPIKTPT